MGDVELGSERVQALDALLELVATLSDDMDASLRAVGLTRSRAHVLHLLHVRGPQPQHVVARALGVAPRTVTGLVDGLVAAGMVVREPHPTDRRAAVVTPTERGRALADGLVAGQTDLARELFAGVDPEDLTAQAEAWRRTTQRLRELGAP